MRYAIEISGRAERDLRALPTGISTRIVRALPRLTRSPRQGPNIRRLVGQDGYRLRVGHYRVLYRIDDVKHVVLIARVGHRREVYRR